MSEAVAYQVLTNKLKLVAADVGLPIAFKDVTFPAEGLSEKPDEYLEVDIFPNDPSNRNVGSGRERFPGIYQITLVTTEQIGLQGRYETARQVASFYVKGDVLFGDGARITVSKKPYVGPGLRDDGNLRIPITVEYNFFA